MIVARRVAFAATAASLLVAVISMLGSTSLTFTAGSSSSSVSCGSPAFPKELIDFDTTDDAANCAGQTPATVALYAVLLALVGLGVIAATSLASPTRRDQAEPVPADTRA